MLYDILLALFGHSGDIVQQCVQKEGSYVVSKDIQMSITERDAINTILKTAGLYKIVKNFCDSVRQNEYCVDLSTILDSTDELCNFYEIVDNKTLKLVNKNLVNSYGYYLSALCNGIQYYLKGYRYVLLKLENIMTSDDTLPISTFSVLMKEQNEILHAINRIIVNYKCASNRYDEADLFSKSRELLDILSDNVDERLFDEICLRLKLNVLNFLKFQLKSWICYGHLLDPYCEFVISYRDMKNIDPDTQMPLNSFHRQEFGTEYESYDSRLLEYEWNYKFYIKLDKRSNFGPIDYKSCKSILFIGKVIRILSRTSTGSRQHLNELADEYIFSVWDEISFDVDKFYSAIENYRTHVSSLFWNFVNKNFNIFSQLELFKNVYLMGYDAVYLDFFDEAYLLMTKKYTDRSFKIINSKLLDIISSLKSVNGSYDRDNENNGLINGPKGVQELSLISEGHLLNEEEMFYKEIQYGYQSKNYEKETNNFELIKYVNNFNINSKFIDINNVKYEGDCVHIGSGSSLWYGEPIFVIHNFNIHLIVDMNKMNIFKQFSIVLSSKYFNTFSESKGDKKGVDTKENISVNFKFIYNDGNENLRVIVKVIYKNMYNTNNKTNKRIIIGIKQEVIKYKKNDKMILELDMSFNKNNLKINLKTFKDQIQELVTQYSMDSIYTNISRSNSYEKINSREYRDEYLGDSEEDDDLNSTLFYRTSSISNLTEIMDLKEDKDENIDISFEITSIDIIEILKLISNSIYIGIINHTDIEDNNKYTEQDNKLYNKQNKIMKEREESISILIWDYYNNLNKYDILPYYKVKQFLNNNIFINIYKENKEEYIEDKLDQDEDIENEETEEGEDSEDEEYTNKFIKQNNNKKDNTINNRNKDNYKNIYQNKYNKYNNKVEEKVDENIGVNEWIYLLLYYRNKFINFINIKSYNNIFQIIFTIKRCLYGLEKRCIIDYKVRADFTKYQMVYDDSEIFSLLRKLYGIKHYFQTNLKMILYYFYNHVIEPEYLELKESIRTSNDFQLIKKKHDGYINNILSKCICNQYVLYSLFQCLDISFKFTYILENIQDIYQLSHKEVEDISNTLNQMKETYQEHFSVLNKNYTLCIF